ncbi:MAG: carbohydrate ABC transporter permease [Phycisphaerales bacterium]
MLIRLVPSAFWRWITRLAVPTALLLAVVCYAAPMVWMVSTSVKPESQAASGELNLLPDPASSLLAHAADNYTKVWTDPTVLFPVYLRNTLIIALLSVVGMTLSSAVVAFGLARLRWRGQGLVMALILGTMMIPFPVIMAPLFVVFRGLGLNGTLAPLWLPAWFGGAFNIFMLRQFFRSIPKELDEAATIDGCSEWGLFWRVILPLSRPALAVVALFHFIYVWNDFLGPLVFIRDQDQFTLAQGLQLYQGQAGMTPWNLLMAASTMVVAPILVLFALTQRTFVRGVASEGLKD